MRRSSGREPLFYSWAIRFCNWKRKTDGEFVVEAGGYKFVNENNATNDEGKYVVVWKQENGEWKIYRDIGL